MGDESTSANVEKAEWVDIFEVQPGKISCSSD